MRLNLSTYAFVAAVLINATAVNAAEFAIPHTFVPNTPAKAAEVNANFNAIKQGIQDLQNQISGYGGSATTAASSCADMHSKVPAAGNGIYWVKPASASSAFRVYCDMSADGGGWTLVWSNLRGGRGKVTTELQWGAAINTLPRIRGELSSDLESFEVYTGLKHWTGLSPNGLLRYDWSHDYGSVLDHNYRCPYTLDSAQNYRINFVTANCEQLIGTVTPGLVASHNGQQFTTYDRDNDTNPANCAGSYTETPWWYGDCWNGSINGGGENEGNNYLNGAYWVSASVSWGAVDGSGAGNGWIYVK